MICPKCNQPAIVKEAMFHWRGKNFSGLVCETCNTLWDNPDDSFKDAVEQSALQDAEAAVYNIKLREFGDACVSGAEKAYQHGYVTAAREIAEGTANFTQAKQRGRYRDSQDMRIEWDRGYADAVCAHRLGHNLEDMLKMKFYAPSTQTMASVVGQLLDGTWRDTRPDPRKPEKE